MKVRIIDGRNTNVCEICDEQFKTEDIIKVIGQFTTKRFYETQFFIHEKCYNKSLLVSNLENIKENTNKLSKEEKKALYMYLYNAWGCRI